MGYINGKRILMSPKVIIGKADGVTTTLEISEDGYWVIGGVKSEHFAIGQDGQTPYIGDDGYWYIDGNNIGVKALGKDGVGISDIILSETNGNKDTYRIILTNGNTAEFTVTNGTKGDKGDPGAPFRVAKTYVSIDAMNKDYSNTSVEEGNFVMIDTGNVNDADNAKLFLKGATAFVYITDLSGSAGIKGDDGKSAYQLAQEAGFEGTLSDWLSSLAGANGKTPYIKDGYWYIDGVSLNVKAQGEDGENGERGTGILKVTTAPTAYTTATGGKTPTHRMSLSTIKTQAGVETVLVGDVISQSYYLYHIYYLDASYAYIDNRQSIRGAEGTSVTVTNVSESTESGGINAVTFSDGNVLNTKNGKDGKTPVKGDDYFTEADKNELISAILANFTDVSEVAR